jgi:hypothetical protein
VGVDASGTTIRLQRVLGLIGHLASIDVTAALLVLLGEGKVGLSGTSPAIDNHRKDQGKENDPCAREVVQ